MFLGINFSKFHGFEVLGFQGFGFKVLGISGFIILSFSTSFQAGKEKQDCKDTLKT
jgi:lysozyme family protein